MNINNFIQQDFLTAYDLQTPVGTPVIKISTISFEYGMMLFDDTIYINNYGSSIWKYSL